MKNRWIRTDPPANRDRVPTLVRVVLVLSFLGVIVAVSGCELVYLPTCSTDCNAAMGNDTYSRSP